MSDSSLLDDRSEHPWHVFVVPTARALAGLLCRVAWFAVFMKILLFS